MLCTWINSRKGRITEAEYERFQQKISGQKDEVNARLAKLHEAENNYYVTAKYILNLSSRAHELFVGSEVEEKRKLIKLVLQNLRIEGENVLYDALRPFDLILKCSDQLAWRPQGDLHSCLRRERATSWTGLDDGDIKYW